MGQGKLRKDWVIEVRLYFALCYNTGMTLFDLKMFLTKNERGPERNENQIRHKNEP